MEIAVIGAGNVGGTLGRRWAGRHSVTFGVRHPDDVRHAALTGAVAGVEEAVAGAEVVVLAVPWPAVAGIAPSLGAAAEAVIVDATNPIGPPAPTTGAGGTEVAALTGSRRVVKAFNTTGWENLSDPGYPGPVRPMMPVAGDDLGAKLVVMDLAEELGFEPLDVGGLDVSAALEHLAGLWITVARSGRSRQIAFGLLRRELP